MCLKDAFEQERPMGKAMTRIVAGLVLLSVLSVPVLTPKGEKKSVGAELVYRYINK